MTTGVDPESIDYSTPNGSEARMSSRGEVVDSLLDLVTQNRVKRKAKDLVSTAIEFTLAVVTIMTTTQNAGNYVTVCTGFGFYTGEVCEISDDRSYATVLPTGLDSASWSLTLGVIVYAVAVAVFAMVHAYRQTESPMPRVEVEEAYKKTNKIPVVDGFLEIPLACRHVEGRSRILVVVAWTIWCLVMAALIYVLSYSYNDSSSLASIFLAAYTFYRLTADLCEYWVHTRPAKEEATLGTSGS
uniref:Uncharacterized protein n=1 Tax=Grammatophora oceanica TaxID=210454 RepID=A0A7S1UPK4_9STRA|mmetsp:Transcript_1215/g.1719  ORF Transcript_1215/g.1719 Transcript_1215/m.1719 type:complete len:243 (+) Transcript_1215:580-1308(+)|eukprot:CAMPEP_0194059180 /NCGR_PEP_ID=MMETSP0009_2-20130614/68318_1 /TAXON_ID=210454 /ORGANISM="Grammatophora oceanica, Strain CCMP 410" /LENGTH=242 /DNA_ID=CAMNT_0038709615 /DNA_START=577 /DNA_END=1305 /DNA_ORIENTATION=+